VSKIITIILLGLFFLGCGSKDNINLTNDPLYEEFYLKTRFIMTDFEKDVYKFLPNIDTKREFIENFWKQRDPTPETEENENKEEFEARIEFANKWFNEGRRKRGWDTIRGRILLQLGFPDRRQTDDFQSYNQVTKAFTTKRINVEGWYYVKYSLALYFFDRNETGRYELSNPPPGLLSAIDLAIASYDLVNRNKSSRLLKFKPNFEKNIITISIPAKKIYFIEEDGKMKAEFGIRIYVHLDFKEIERIDKTHTISEDKEQILKQNTVEIAIPYQLGKKGRYNFEIILEDILNKSKYRSYLKVKN